MKVFDCGLHHPSSSHNPQRPKASAGEVPNSVILQLCALYHRPHLVGGQERANISEGLGLSDLDRVGCKFAIQV